jgi:hypothetical protein
MIPSGLRNTTTLSSCVPQKATLSSVEAREAAKTQYSPVKEYWYGSCYSASKPFRFIRETLHYFPFRRDILSRFSLSGEK